MSARICSCLDESPPDVIGFGSEEIPNRADDPQMLLAGGAGTEHNGAAIGRPDGEGGVPVSDGVERAGSEQRLTQVPGNQFATDWSRDGR